MAWRANGQAAFGIFEITGVGLAAMLAGVLTMLVLGPKLLPARPDNEIADRHHLDRHSARDGPLGRPRRVRAGKSRWKVTERHPRGISPTNE